MSEDATLRSLLAACKEDPDDAPRLVLADWLTEYGEEARGELLRVQCALASLDERAPDRPRLLEQEAELLRAHRSAWLGPLADLRGKWSFRRGLLTFRFASEAFVGQSKPTAEMSRCADWIEEAQPRVASPQRFGAILRHPLLAGVSALDLSGCNLGNKHIRALTRAKLANLVRLVLRGDPADGGVALDASGAKALAKAPCLHRLTHLDLTANSVGPEVVHALAASPHVGRLTHLELGSNRLGAEGARALARSPSLLRLRHLDLRRNGIGDAGITALAMSRILSGLVRLDLRLAGMTEVGARALAQSQQLPGLTHLGLASNLIGDEGVRALAGWLPAQLTHLELDANSIGDAGAQALAECQALRGLSSLGLRDNAITNVGARALAESPNLAKLAILLMGRNRLTARTKERLRERFGEGVVL
jgi:uncharacterized protein (TIGR02996 family)